MKKIIQNPNAYVQGNVEKLVQIANVEGDLVIVTEKTGLGTIKKLENESSNSWDKENYEQIAKLFDNVVDLIGITVRSERFGKNIKISVPAKMKAWAVINILVNSLSLPEKMTVDDLGISFKFVYSLGFNGSSLDSRVNLQDAGIKDGSEVQLLIDISIADPLLRKLQNELRIMHSTRFMAIPEGWYEELRSLENEVETLKHELHPQYVNDLWQEPWFGHLGNDL